MKNAQPKMPPAIAWDFRKVDDSALEFATLYEYARSSDKIRNEVLKCLQSKVGSKRISEHILTAIIEERKAKKPYPDCFPDGVYKIASDSLEKATRGNFKLIHIIMHFRPDFPEPWMSFPIKFEKNKDFSRIIVNAGDSPSPGDFKISLMPLHGATVKDIVSDFEKWLRKEIKQNPEKFSTMKGKGRKGQLPIPPLAWLAAYRIHKAGVTFDGAQTLFEKEPNHYGHLPRYSEKSAWSDAIKKARQKLFELESGQL